MNEFNDPFDCQFQVKFVGSDYDKVKFIEDLLKKASPHLTRQKRRSVAHTHSKSLSDSDPANTVRVRARQAIEEWGICCLSVVRDNILMWSHYAKEHYGFCLEFSNELQVVPMVYQKDEGQKAPFPVVPLRVMYSEEYPVFNPLSPDDSANKTLLTKAKQWEYEREWRMVCPGMTGSYTFKSHCLTGVIFGCRMLEEHKALIRGWCKNRQPGMKYYEARESEDSYSLNIVEVS